MNPQFAKFIVLPIVILNNLFALTALWAIYLIVHEAGWIAGFFALGFALWIGRIVGPALLFAVSATVIHFRYDAVGIWFPLLSYGWALTTLGLQSTVFKGTSTLPEFLDKD